MSRSGPEIRATTRREAFATLAALIAVDLALPWATCGGVWASDAVGGALTLGLLGVGAILAAPRPGLGIGLVAGTWCASVAWVVSDQPLAAVVGAVGLCGAARSAWPLRLAIAGVCGLTGPLGLTVGLLAGIGARWSPLGIVAALGAILAPAEAVTGTGTLLIVVDALRADAALPVARRIGAPGEAWATAPWTLPSMASLLTGQPVDVHQAGHVPGGEASIHADVPLLAERFSAGGYHTVAVTSNPMCRSELGFGRGFAWFDGDACPLAWNGAARPMAVQVALRLGWLDDTDRQGAERQVDRVLAALAGREGPTFAWLHLMDVHLPYRHGSGPAHRAPRDRVAALPPEVVRAAYRGEVEAVDRALTRLLDALPPGWTVVLTSDHGEELWDHGGYEHGHGFWEELLTVPLVISGVEVPHGASLLDVAPTLLRAAGLPTDGLAGRPLQDPLPERFLLAQDLLYGPARSYAVRRGDEKIVVGPESVRFDLGRDPGERSPLPVDPAAWPRPAAWPSAPPQTPTVEDRAQLEALGYQ